ncbi:MAG: hypothetical protein J6A28_00865 [Clostridia bacterium]|nr:hypothetical protein [Clostridia bacterium]
MDPIVIEIIGIVSTVLILFSMLFKTTTLVGDIRMRALNLVGSVVFVVYGALLPAISTAVLNGALVIVNTFHLISLCRQYKKEKQEKNAEKTERLSDKTATATEEKKEN